MLVLVVGFVLLGLVISLVTAGVGVEESSDKDLCFFRSSKRALAALFASMNLSEN